MLQVSWLAILLILIPVTKAVVPERVKFKAFTSKQLQNEQNICKNSHNSQFEQNGPHFKKAKNTEDDIVKEQQTEKSAKYTLTLTHKYAHLPLLVITNSD